MQLKEIGFKKIIIILILNFVASKANSQEADSACKIFRKDIFKLFESKINHYNLTRPKKDKKELYYICLTKNQVTSSFVKQNIFGRYSSNNAKKLNKLIDSLVYTNQIHNLNLCNVDVIIIPVMVTFNKNNLRNNISEEQFNKRSDFLVALWDTFNMLSFKNSIIKLIITPMVITSEYFPENQRILN